MHNIAHSPKMLSVTPALPGRNIPAAVAFYRDRLGFEVRHVDGGLGIMGRDEIEIHLWEANNPHTPGAEPHLAGSASCRVRVNGVHGLYDEYRDQGVIHPNGALGVQPWDVENLRSSIWMAMRSPSSSASPPVAPARRNIGANAYGHSRSQSFRRRTLRLSWAVANNRRGSTG